MKDIKLACIFLASGHSTRFEGNKLLSTLGEKPLIDTVFGNFPCEYFHQTIVVTRYAPVAVSAVQHGYTVVENHDTENNIATTIRLGIEAAAPDIQGCMFSVCDQPMLTAPSIHNMVEVFRTAPASIVALGHRGKRGNPVIFPRSLFHELATLPPHEGGSCIIQKYPELLNIVEAASRRELLDIDYRADLEKLEASHD